MALSLLWEPYQVNPDAQTEKWQKAHSVWWLHLSIQQIFMKNKVAALKSLKPKTQMCFVRSR